MYRLPSLSLISALCPGRHGRELESTPPRRGHTRWYAPVSADREHGAARALGRRQRRRLVAAVVVLIGLDGDACRLAEALVETLGQFLVNHLNAQVAHPAVLLRRLAGRDLLLRHAPRQSVQIHHYELLHRRKAHLVDELGAVQGAAVADDGAAAAAVVAPDPEGEVGAAQHARAHRDVRHPLPFALPKAQ
jgi:hypothetical protein